MLARLSAFVIWGLVAATAVFWGLRLFVHAPVAPVYAVAVGEADPARGDLSRLLGAAPVAQSAVAAPPPEASRFKLLGIVAPRSGSSDASRSPYGVALIAVDGKMPKAYAVGARVDGDLVLQTVSLRTVSIANGQGGTAPITLELPPLAGPATGTLPVGGAPSVIAPPPTSTVRNFSPPGAPQPFVPSPQGMNPPPAQQPGQQPVPQAVARPDVGAPTE